MDEKIILGIESSCDETSASVVINGRRILSNVIASQIDIHKRFGGVVPEIASRNHTMAIIPVIDEALTAAGVRPEALDAVGVTCGAGLIGALLVGVSTAKALSFALNKPLVAVSHTRAHVAGNYLAHPDLEPPFICLVVSGGHTSIVRVDGYTEQTVIGATTDDACGEAFDKVARILGLDYPGGPAIDKLAATGAANIDFFKNAKPSGGGDYNFSYSGLKTAVINYVHNAEQAGRKINPADLAASFSEYAVAPLVAKTFRAAREYGLNTVAMCGGVSANTLLRRRMTERAERERVRFLYPPTVLCTDNAAIVASLAYYQLQAGIGLADLTLNAQATLA
ncbi:MAG: tRNA (adenosine(37)-N6)-threonylcarbamoyltransferase complex transferase subunit TsaD [Clostridiales bacterium]|jgi:N6-L-threonylcarbamoyladenine synthase|nr:tRNA (adenosine(37)-N6)-threonylcarbamoyltransferase complex transferase subunit TsaD [Clostridiales bacterium]